MGFTFFRTAAKERAVLIIFNPPGLCNIPSCKIQDTVFWWIPVPKFPVDSGLLRFTQIRFPVIPVPHIPVSVALPIGFIFSELSGTSSFSGRNKIFFLFVSDIQTHHLFFEIRRYF